MAEGAGFDAPDNLLFGTKIGRRSARQRIGFFLFRGVKRLRRTRPYVLYELLCKLRGWDGPGGHKQTHQVGRDTNNLVYERPAPGVLAELQRLNPMLSIGRRRNRHHQWFTPELGHPKLKEHLASVMALMRAAPPGNWTAFYRSLQRAFPKRNEDIPLPLGDDG